MSAQKLLYGARGRAVAFEQPRNVGEYPVVLEFHVLAHFRSVLVVKFQDKKGYFVLYRTVYRFDKLSPYSGKLEVQKVVVGVFQIRHQCGNGNAVDEKACAFVAELYEIGNGKKCVYVDAVFLAYLADGLVANAQRYAEAAHRLEQTVLVADDVAHLVVCFVV